MPYWPDDRGTKEVGPYVLTHVSEREATDYKVRVLEIAPVDQVTSKHQTHTPACVADVKLSISVQHFGFETNVLFPLNSFPITVKFDQNNLALPVPELARPRCPPGAWRCPQLPD